MKWRCGALCAPSSPHRSSRRRPRPWRLLSAVLPGAGPVGAATIDKGGPGGPRELFDRVATARERVRVLEAALERVPRP